MRFHVKNIIDKFNLIDINDKIVLGLSGGADSISLLHVLINLKSHYNLEIYPVHINHKLRKSDSKEDELFVRKICSNLNLKLFVYEFDVNDYAKKNKVTIEEAGRTLRYDSFYRTLKKINGNKIATGHNKNDQGETLLMRFFRGTGLNGLAGIKIKDETIIRPLLFTNREDIELYCEKNSYDYINDLTNKMPIYTRNKIRNEMIPYIERNFNPNIINTLSKQSIIYNEENVFLDDLTNKISKDIVTIKDNETYININTINKVDDVIKRRIVRNALKKYNKTLKDITIVNIEDIICLIKNESGKMINLSNNIIAKKQYDFIILTKRKEEEKISFKYSLEFDRMIYIKEINKYISLSKSPVDIDSEILNHIYTKIYSYDTIMNVIQLRNRQAGDVINLKVGTKKIKDVFIGDKIPRDERDKIPLLTDGNNIIWILDEKGRESLLYKKKTENMFYVQLWENSYDE